MEKHLNLKISGHVQGVGYRAFVQFGANSCHVNGFVRNEPDGSVYAEAEGTEEQLSNFVSWCRKGPGYGYVSEVEVSEGKLKNFEDFRIAY